MIDFYTKVCENCNQVFIVDPKNITNMCPECINKTFCDRCCKECTYKEYLTNAGLCDECAEIVEKDNE